MTIQPIETHYAGCRFRSRLEARWAVFFDVLGIRWEYEPQGYVLPSGPYLPDFQLFGLGGDGCRCGATFIWFEVKPPTGASDYDKRWTELAESTGLPLIVAFGMPRPDGDMICSDDYGTNWMDLFEADGGDNNRAFCTCAVCGKLGITYEGRSGRVCAHGADDHGTSANDERILSAYRAARSARFEHGESG
jgi:hypothetical protein